jgi:hypothetical protein
VVETPLTSQIKDNKAWYEAYLVGVGVAPSIVDRLRDELVDG